MQNTTHPNIKAKFSQISCVAIGVWLIRHIEDPAPLRPPDDVETLQGLRNLLPDLGVVLFQMLRESTLNYDINVRGQGNATRRIVRENFRVHQNNARMRRAIRAVLRARFTENQTLNSRGPWIVDAIAP